MRPEAVIRRCWHTARLGGAGAQRRGSCCRPLRACARHGTIVTGCRSDSLAQHGCAHGPAPVGESLLVARCAKPNGGVSSLGMPSRSTKHSKRGWRVRLGKIKGQVNDRAGHAPKPRRVSRQEPPYKANSGQARSCWSRARSSYRIGIQGRRSDAATAMPPANANHLADQLTPPGWAGVRLRVRSDRAGKVRFNTLVGGLTCPRPPVVVARLPPLRSANGAAPRSRTASWRRSSGSTCPPPRPAQLRRS